MEQNFGPHMEQKWAVLAGSCGSVASWNRRAVTGSRLRLNWSYLHGPGRGELCVGVSLCGGIRRCAPLAGGAAHHTAAVHGAAAAAAQ